jgi:hypothetical protein
MSTGKKTPRSGRLRSGAKATLEAGVAASMMFGKLSCPASGPAPATERSVATVVLPPPLAESAAPPAVASATAPESAVLAGLRRDAVLSTAPARRTLFTWTTRDQITALTRSRVLLTRTESPVHGPAFYDQVLAARAAAGDALARKLRTPGFARSRFAWANPWATLLGWPSETYGDELIAVRLKPEAWTAKLTTGAPGWEVFDADNGRVDPAEAARHPERIGAVYFVQDTPASGYGHTNAGPQERAAYREYVLCNESMIESWSIGADAVAPAVSASADLIERLASELPPGETVATPLDTWNADVAHTVWPGPALLAPLQRTYEAALTFPNPSYVLTPGRMTALARSLRAAPQHGPSLTHTPKAAPPVASGSVLPPPIPRQGPAQQGTWARRGGTP